MGHSIGDVEVAGNGRNRGGGGVDGGVGGFHDSRGGGGSRGGGSGGDGGPGGGWPDLDGLATESPTNPGLSKHYKLHYGPK